MRIVRKESKKGLIKFWSDLVDRALWSGKLISDYVNCRNNRLTHMSLFWIVFSTFNRLFITYFKNSPLESEKFSCLVGVYSDILGYLGFPVGRWEFLEGSASGMIL